MAREDGNCPSCGKSWRTTKIPEKYKHMYGGEQDENGDKWFSCLVGIYDRDLDRTTHCQCPFCDWTSDGSPPAELQKFKESFKKDY